MKDPLEEAGDGVDRRGATFILIAFVVGIVALAVFRPGSRDALMIIGGIIGMVMLHEAGHYIVAKRSGMKVTEFFLGFGPRLWSFKRGETEYGVKAIPAGGYVRIVGMSNMEPVPPEDEPRTFRKGSYKNRLKVVLAGVTINAILAFALFYVVLVARGVDEPSTRVDTVVKYVTKPNGSFLHDSTGKRVESAAHRAGFHQGDRIVAVEGRRVTTWQELRDAIQARAGRTTAFTVVRRHERLSLDATLTRLHGQGFLGVEPAFETTNVGVLDAVPRSFETMGKITGDTATAIGKLFTPSGLNRYTQNFDSNAPKAGSTADQARPRSLIGIIDYGSRVIHGDIWALLWLLGGISLILAFFNTLPLLPFDGGHAAVVVYEWVASKVKGRRVVADYRKLMPMTAVVLAVFLTLGLSAMFLDIKNLGQ